MKQMTDLQAPYVTGENEPLLTVNFTSAKPTDWSPDLLSGTLTARLQKLGASLGRAAKVESRRQWQIAEVVNKEWADLEREYRAEGVTREMYLAACSQWLNACAGWSLLTGSGETLRRWCDVARQFEGVRGVENYKAAFSFDHFFQARKLYNAGDVSNPISALEEALLHHWTADEMYQALAAPPPNGAFYDWASRRLLALREADWSQLPAEVAAGVKRCLDAAAELLEGVGK